MGMYIDTADTAETAGTRALLDTVDDSTFVSLGVLFGTDLCVLGGTGHPTCWPPLKSAWQHLGQHERDQIAERSTEAMRDRDLITEQPAPGTSVIVQEIPERTDDTARSPLNVMFSYRLSTQAFAAAELARWALKQRGEPCCVSVPTCPPALAAAPQGAIPGHRVPAGGGAGGRE